MDPKDRDHARATGGKTMAFVVEYLGAWEVFIERERDCYLAMAFDTEEEANAYAKAWNEKG